MKEKHWLYFFSALMLLLFYSCLPVKRLERANKDLKSMVYENDVFSKAFSGFVLYDPMLKEKLVEINGHKHFTPASNVKIATLLASLEILGDSIPLLQYAIIQDSFFFRGTGNPLNLNPNFRDNKYLVEFLGMREEKLLYVPQNPSPIHYGEGWAWDDFPYYYQLERNALPIYGNALHFRAGYDSIQFSPQYLEDCTKITWGNKVNRYLRNPRINHFEIYLNGEEISASIPIIMSDSLVANLLSFYLREEVGLKEENESMFWQTKYMKFPDSLLIRMMQESDNFLAEQLLLMASFQLTDTLNVKNAISHCMDEWSKFLPDSIRWVDASGLSRYNLITPMTMVAMLERIKEKKGMPWIRSVFAQGKSSGTIKHWYAPYVFAKTGTLSNNHNLSGYMVTKSNKVLIFSFMHNHFLLPSSSFKKEMQELLNWIYLNY